MRFPLYSLLLATLIACCSLSANAKAANTTHLNRLNSRAVTPLDTLNLRDFGAIGNGVANDGPALQAALNSLAARGGGTLFVPAGSYALLTPVKRDFSNIAFISIRGPDPLPDGSTYPGRGLGLSSEFVIRVGAAQTALTISGAQTLSLQNIGFTGDVSVINDAQITLSIAGVASATVHACEFYGLASLVPGGAIVQAYDSSLVVEDSAFLGCATTSGYGTSVVQNILWKGITITRTRFVDYGARPNYYSKTTLAPPYSWISIGNAAPTDAASSRREAQLRDLFLDEGAFIGVTCDPLRFSQASAPINLVFISGLQMNVSNLGAGGLFIKMAERVLIEKSHFGWTHNADAAMQLSLVGEAILDQVECVDGSNRIRADAGTGRVTVVNSVYQYLDSLARSTVTLKTATLATDPVQYVRQQYLNALGREPDPSSYFYWASRILACDQDTVCADRVRSALADFFNNHPPASFTLYGWVMENDGRAVSGATVTITGSTELVTQTDSSGAYSLPNLPTGGSYTVTIARKNYTFNAPSRTIIAPTQDQLINFFGKIITYAISGRVMTSTGKALPKTNIIISGDSDAVAVSDSNGDYRFNNIRAEGNYLVSAERPNYDFEPHNATAIRGLASNLTINFTGTVYTYNIRGSTGMKGVSVTLTGDASANFLTSDDGSYSFDVSAEGNYTVTASKATYTFIPASYTFINLSGNKRADFTDATKLLLFSQSNSDAAVALGSVAFSSGPFSSITTTNLSLDHRRRIMLFALNLRLNPGETAAAITAQAEDSQHKLYALTVEYVGKVAPSTELTQVNIKLPDELANAGDAWISIKLHDQTSNKVRIKIVP